MPIIIVIGPDGAGKSTKCKELSKQLNMPIKSFSYPKTQEEKDIMFEMYLKEISENDNVIYDRFAYCEWVYGPVMRDKSYITYEQLLRLEAALNAKGAIVIYCYNKPRVLIKRCNERGEKYIPSKKIRKIKKRYDILMKDLFHLIPVFYFKV